MVLRLIRGQKSKLALMISQTSWQEDLVKHWKGELVVLRDIEKGIREQCCSGETSEVKEIF